MKAPRVAAQGAPRHRPAEPFESAFEHGLPGDRGGYPGTELDPAAAADRRAPVCCGRRVKLGPRVSPAITRQAVLEGTLERLGGPVTWSALRGDTRRFHFGLRLPAFLARALRSRPKNLMGVNFSVQRSAFFAVNGYDEQWSHRRQDKDLDLRLSRGGFAYTPLLYQGIVYHLHHSERLPSEATERRVEQESRSGRVRCEVGLTDERR